MDAVLIAEFDKIVADIQYTREKLEEAKREDEIVVTGPRGGQKITAWLNILDQHQQALMRAARLLKQSKIDVPIGDDELSKLLDD